MAGDTASLEAISARLRWSCLFLSQIQLRVSELATEVKGLAILCT